MSNENHTNQDGRLGGFISLLFCLLLHLCLLFFDILSRSIYLIFIVPSIRPSYFSLCPHLSLCGSPFLSRPIRLFPSRFLLLPFFVFIPLSIPLPSIANTLSVILFFNISIPAGPTWKNFRYFSPQSFRHELRCVLTMYAHLESVLVFLKWEIYFLICVLFCVFCFFFNRLPWSHLEKCIYRRRGLCEHEQICLGNMWVHPEMVWTNTQFVFITSLPKVCFKRGKCFACAHMWKGKGQKTRG